MQEELEGIVEGALGFAGGGADFLRGETEGGEFGLQAREASAAAGDEKGGWFGKIHGGAWKHTPVRIAMVEWNIRSAESLFFVFGCLLVIMITRK